MQKDYYAVLSLPRNATGDEIRARFRTLARTRHPDRFRGPEKAAAEVEFQAVTEAFNVLSDPERRRLHDLELLRPAPPGAREAEGRGEVARVYLQRGVKAYRDGNYLEAAAENIMFGGAPPYIQNLVPSDIVVRRNHLTKPLAWRTQNWLVKNLFEL